jgi:hypothetical protein
MGEPAKIQTIFIPSPVKVFIRLIFVLINSNETGKEWSRHSKYQPKPCSPQEIELEQEPQEPQDGELEDHLEQELWQ